MYLKETGKGYLYVVRCEVFYKIGITKNVSSRMSALASSNPFPISVALLFEYDCMQRAADAEFQLHFIFNQKRVRGEWFELDRVDLQRIKTATQGRLLLEQLLDLPASWFVKENRQHYWRTRYQNAKVAFSEKEVRYRTQISFLKKGIK